VALAAIVAMRMSISNLLEMPRIEDRSKTHRVVSANRIDIVASALETVQLLLAGHSVATDLPARPFFYRNRPTPDLSLCARPRAGGSLRGNPTHFEKFYRGRTACLARGAGLDPAVFQAVIRARHVGI
jgi:hypothetical protein